MIPSPNTLRYGMVINETADSIKRQRPISARTRAEHPNALMSNQLALDTWFKNSLSGFLIYASRELVVNALNPGCAWSRPRVARYQLLFRDADHNSAYLKLVDELGAESLAA
jgi:hypothetical protein